jgi:hypothetical protein
MEYTKSRGIFNRPGGFGGAFSRNVHPAHHRCSAQRVPLSAILSQSGGPAMRKKSREDTESVRPQPEPIRGGVDE